MSTKIDRSEYDALILKLARVETDRAEDMARLMRERDAALGAVSLASRDFLDADAARLAALADASRLNRLCDDIHAERVKWKEAYLVSANERDRYESALLEIVSAPDAYEPVGPYGAEAARATNDERERNRNIARKALAQGDAKAEGRAS